MTGDQNESTVVSHARERLASAGLQSESWAFNCLIDDRPCLVESGGLWVAGFFERGSFDIRFSEPDVEIAVTRFIAWVRSVTESSRLSAEATSRWLDRNGKQRP
jgi:hypothetical protein